MRSAASASSDVISDRPENPDVNTVTLQGNPTFQHENRKGNGRSRPDRAELPHCQEIL